MRADAAGCNRHRIGNVADCWSRLFQARVLDEIAGVTAEVQEQGNTSASQKSTSNRS